MTRKEFNAAVKSLLHNIKPHDDRGEDAVARIIAASGFVMKHRQGVPDDVSWKLPLSALPEFLVSLDRRQRRLLREIAGDMTSERIH